MNLPPTRTRRQLTPADFLPIEEYARIRAQRRREITELKKHRQVEVGPFATFYFENFATMWGQVQEMLYIEKGGEAQLADELAAYNPLIPQGSELVSVGNLPPPPAGAEIRRVDVIIRIRQEARPNATVD